MPPPLTRKRRFSAGGWRRALAPEQKDVHEAEVALSHATLPLVLVINSQSEVFSLGLDADTKACWDEVTAVWKDRPHGPALPEATPPCGLVPEGDSCPIYPIDDSAPVAALIDPSLTPPAIMSHEFLILARMDALEDRLDALEARVAQLEATPEP